MSEFEGHTPGPWFVISGHILAGSENQLDDGEALAIADIDMDMRIDFDTTGAANAALIAAAPTLLAERDRLKADNEFLHKRRGELVIDRDRARAMLTSTYDTLASINDHIEVGDDGYARLGSLNDRDRLQALCDDLGLCTRFAPPPPLPSEE